MSVNQVYQGIGATLTLQVLNADGTPATGQFAGTEPLYGALYTGTAFSSPVLLLSPVWLSGPNGTINVPFQANATKVLWPGRYSILLALADFSRPLVSDSVTILASPLGTVAVIYPYTRAMVDLALLGLLSGPLTLAKFPLDVATPVTQFGTAITRALTFMKYPPSNPLQPTDADIARLPASLWVELIDIAEAEMYNEAISQSAMRSSGATSERWPDYSYNIDPNAINYSLSFGTGRMKRVRDLYGYGVAPLKYGSIDLGFQADLNRYNIATAGDEAQ